jgi:hypothetical protein
MPVAPRWTTQELDYLLDHPDHSAASLAGGLPQRSADAVTTVRAAVHAWHQDADAPFAQSGLSASSRRHLEQRRGALMCAVCRGRF